MRPRICGPEMGTPRRTSRTRAAASHAPAWPLRLLSWAATTRSLSTTNTCCTLRSGPAEIRVSVANLLLPQSGKVRRAARATWATPRSGRATLAGRTRTGPQPPSRAAWREFPVRDGRMSVTSRMTVHAWVRRGDPVTPRRSCALPLGDCLSGILGYSKGRARKPNREIQKL